MSLALTSFTSKALSSHENSNFRSCDLFDVITMGSLQSEKGRTGATGVRLALYSPYVYSSFRKLSSMYFSLFPSCRKVSSRFSKVKLMGFRLPNFNLNLHFPIFINMARTMLAGRNSAILAQVKYPLGLMAKWMDARALRSTKEIKKGERRMRTTRIKSNQERKLIDINNLNLFMAFNPDSRNLGGRQEIVDLLNNHHLSLLNMKATMNTRGPGFRFAKSKKNLHDDQFKQVRATFEAIRHIKGGTDSRRPKTFGLARKFHSFQKPNYELTEHHRNTKSLQQRLLRIGSMTERKKNPYDPIANPALFFRKAGDSDKSTSLISYAKRIRLNDRKNIENNMYAFQTVYYSPGHHSPRSKGSILGSPVRRAYRSATASNFYGGDDSSLTRSPIRRLKPAVSKSFEPKKVEQRRESHGGILIPIVPGSGSDAYMTLKTKIVDSIIEHRLFKEEQLEAFFRRCVDQNVHLDGDRIRQICEEIKADLNS